MRKLLWITAAAAAATVLSTTAFAAENKKVEVDGSSFEIPGEYADLITVKTDDGGMLVSLYETASVEAAKDSGNTGAGWLCGISKISEPDLKELRSGGMDGMEVFAEDNDTYLIYNSPTDVRFVRATPEENEEGLKQYGDLCEWAYENVRSEILANNPRLEEEVYTNTNLDMHLAKAAYQPGTNFEVRSLAFEGKDLPAVDAQDHLEDLAEDFVFSMADEEEAPDGEYIVLAFPDDNTRYDFFEGSDLIREVITDDDGEEYVNLYIGSAKEMDEDDTPYTVMSDWVEDILEGKSDD